MIAHVSRPRFTLDLLIAEARRRARQRRVLAAALAIALFGAGAGVVFGSLAIYRAVRSARAYESGGLITPAATPVTASSAAQIASVSAASGAGAWIVGSVAWHWDGQSWRSVPLPKVHGAELQSVATISADDAWAVGWRESEEEVHSRALIEHWNGRRWSVVRSPFPHGSTLSSVSTSGPRDVWAAGTTFHSKSDKGAVHKARPLLLHWGGVSWHKVALPWSEQGMQLEKVVATSGAGVWAVVLEVGKNDETIRAAFWNGERWRFVPAPFGSKDPLAGFDATAWNDAWAVGSYRDGRVSRSLAAHWDGRAWHVMSVPGRPGDNDAELDSVADVKPGDVWAVGQSNDFEALPDGGSVTSPVPVFLHWDGGSWSVTPGPAPLLGWGGPLSVAADGAGSAWAIATCPVDNLIFRWMHGSWVLAKHPHDQHWPSSLPANARIRREKLPTCSAVR